MTNGVQYLNVENLVYNEYSQTVSILNAEMYNFVLYLNFGFQILKSCSAVRYCR